MLLATLEGIGHCLSPAVHTCCPAGSGSWSAHCICSRVCWVVLGHQVSLQQVEAEETVRLCCTPPAEFHLQEPQCTDTVYLQGHAGQGSRYIYIYTKYNRACEITRQPCCVHWWAVKCSLYRTQAQCQFCASHAWHSAICPSLMLIVGHYCNELFGNSTCWPGVLQS